jgi:hypothetical protein
MPDNKPMGVENDLASSSGTPSELQSQFDKKQPRIAQNEPAPSQAEDSLPAFGRERKKTTTASSPGSEYWLP